MSTTSDKPRSRLPRLRKVPGMNASSQNASRSYNSIHDRTCVHSGASSLALTKHFHNSRIPRLPTTTLFGASSRQVLPRRERMTDTLPRMSCTSRTSNKLTSRIPRLPGSTLRVHTCTTTNLSSKRPPTTNSTKPSLERDIRQLKNQVVVLEMDKADLIQQLEITNQHCSALQRRLVSLESNDIQSSTCRDPSFDCVSNVEAALAKKKVAGDPLTALERLYKQTRRCADEMNGWTPSRSPDLDNTTRKNSTATSFHEHLDDNCPRQINRFCQKSAFKNGQVQIEDAESKSTAADDHLTALQRLKNRTQSIVDEMKEWTEFQSHQTTNKAQTCDDDTNLSSANHQSTHVADDLLQAPLEPRPNHADTAQTHTSESCPLTVQPQEMIDNDDCVANTASHSAQLEPVCQPFDDANQIRTTFSTTQTNYVNPDWLEAMYASNDQILSIVCEFLEASLGPRPGREDTTITDMDPISSCPTMDMPTTSPKQRTLNVSTDSVNSPSASLLSSMEPSQFVSFPPTVQTFDSTEKSSEATTCSGADGLATTCVAMSPTRASVQEHEDVNIAETNDQDDSRPTEADSMDILNSLVSQVYDAWISDSFQTISLYSHSAIMHEEGHAQGLLEKSVETRSTSKKIDAVVHIAQDDTPCGEPSARIDSTPSTSLFLSPHSMEPPPRISFAPIEPSCGEMPSPSNATTCPDISVDRLAAVCFTTSRGCASVEMDDNVVLADPNFLEDSFSIEPDENFLDISFEIQSPSKSVLYAASIQDSSSRKANTVRPNMNTCLHFAQSVKANEDFLETSFEIEAPIMTIFATQAPPSRTTTTTRPKYHTSLPIPSDVMDDQDFLELSFELAPRDTAVDLTMDSRVSRVPRKSICDDRRLSYLNGNPQVHHQAISDSNNLDKLCAIAATSDKIGPPDNVAKMEELRQTSHAWVEQATFNTESQLYSTRPITRPMDEEINRSIYTKETLSTQQFSCRMDLETHANLDVRLVMRQCGVQV